MSTFAEKYRAPLVYTYEDVERRLREAHVTAKTEEIIRRGIEKHGRGSVARFEYWLTQQGTSGWEYYDFLDDESPK
jgi:hypothetical protein